MARRLRHPGRPGRADTRGLPRHRTGARARDSCGAAAAVAEWRRGRQDGRRADGPLAEVPGPRPDNKVAGWEVITDAPEAPEDVLNAAAQWIAADVCPCDDECDSGCIGTGDRLARILADAGLLVGTTPEAPKCDREHLPEGHVPITFNGWSDDDLRVAARVVGSGALGAAIRAELPNRGASS